MDIVFGFDRSVSRRLSALSRFVSGRFGDRAAKVVLVDADLLAAVGEAGVAGSF